MRVRCTAAATLDWREGSLGNTPGDRHPPDSVTKRGSMLDPSVSGASQKCPTNDRHRLKFIQRTPKSAIHLSFAVMLLLA